MVQIKVNNQTIEAKPGETILSATKRAGIKVPTLCYLENHPPVGRCRVCVVEVEGRQDLVPACAFPVAEGMKIKTHSPRVMETRRNIVELMLSNHPDDCLFCVRNGNCELRMLADELGIRERTLIKGELPYEIDDSSTAIVRDPNKCILCGKCVRVCEEIQGVNAIELIGRGLNSRVGISYELPLSDSRCINCGQCVMVCPTGALYEKSHIQMVIDALNDPEKVVVVQHAPAISVSLAEELNLDAGIDICDKMTAALRQIGFDYVFDTSFTADLTIMEEGSELVQRLTTGGALPMLTSCSPGWIKFLEQFYPDMLDNISTCKSPQQMMGAIIKSFFAQKANIDPEKIFSVSVMPCTAKKFERQRPEMGQNNMLDIDAVLTTRELGRLIQMYGINVNSVKPEAADTPFGERSTAGKIFGATGGVMEAAIRSAYFLVTGKELQNLNVEAARGLEGIKEAAVNVDGTEVKVAVVSGLANARKLLDAVKAGKKELHFIEVMTCPGGCVGGGGQPIGTDVDKVKKRTAALYKLDSESDVRVSHKNESIHRLYEEFLGKPLGERSHKLLHTHYHKREMI